MRSINRSPYVIHLLLAFAILMSISSYVMASVDQSAQQDGTDTIDSVLVGGQEEKNDEWVESRNSAFLSPLPNEADIPEPNLVVNGSFEDGMEGWAISCEHCQEAGSEDVFEVIEDQENGGNLLHVTNNSGEDLRVFQDLVFSEWTNDAVYARYRVKLLDTDPGALTSMDLYVTYRGSSDRPGEAIISPFKVTQDQAGEWLTLEYVFRPTWSISKVRVYLLNYYAYSDIYYDDIHVERISAAESVYIEGSDTDLEIDSCGRLTFFDPATGQVVSDHSGSFGDMRLQDGSLLFVENVQEIAPGMIRVQYAGSNVEVDYAVESKDGYFTFRIENITNPDEVQIDEIQILKIQHAHDHRRDAAWASEASDDTLFGEIFTLNPETVCYYGSSAYTATGYASLGYENAAVALILTRKADLMSTIEDMIVEEGLPYVEHQGGWIRDTQGPSNSYLFAAFSHENHEEILAQAIAGGFKQVLMWSPLVHGHYNQPRSNRFESIDQLIEDMQKFIDAGINIGIHSHFFTINVDDPFMSAENLFKLPVAELGSVVSVDDDIIRLDMSTIDRDLLNEYVKRFTSMTSYHIVIDGEILEVDSVDGDIWTCRRGLLGSEASEHLAGSQVYYVPEPVRHRFYINPEQEDVVAESVRCFAEVANRLQVNFIYADGYDFIPQVSKYGPADASYQFMTGLLPYLEALDGVPILQTGHDGGGAYGYYYAARVASWDGVVFDNKGFSMDHKVASILNRSEFHPLQLELGWWKFHGSGFDNGLWDFEATTPDDTHYVALKMLANDTSLGLQYGFYSQNHERIDDLIDIIGSYMAAAENGDIDPAILEYFAQAEIEGELIDGEIIEKITQSQYVVLSDSEFSTFEVYNPLNSDVPKSTIEIRAAFDYYQWDDPTHLSMAVFGEGDQYSLGTSNDDITAALDENGVLSIKNDGNNVGRCWIEIPGDFDLTGRRGVGFSVTGDGKGEEVVVRLDGLQHGFREYAATIDQSGYQEFLLGDAGCYSGEGFIGKGHWHYNFSDVGNVRIYVDELQPGENYTLQFHELKGLSEKGISPLVNPSINVNGQTVAFPVTLYMDDTRAHILNYDTETGVYKVYDNNYKLLDEGVIEDADIEWRYGRNMVTASSHMEETNLFSSRMDVRVEIFDLSTVSEEPPSDDDPISDDIPDEEDPPGEDPKDPDDTNVDYAVTQPDRFEWYGPRDDPNMFGSNNEINYDTPDIQSNSASSASRAGTSNGISSTDSMIAINAAYIDGIGTDLAQTVQDEISLDPGEGLNRVMRMVPTAKSSSGDGLLAIDQGLGEEPEPVYYKNKRYLENAFRTALTLNRIFREDEEERNKLTSDDIRAWTERKLKELRRERLLRLVKNIIKYLLLLDRS